MIDAERILAVIPARGGSKGVPGKNVAVLGGRPLIVWSIQVALSVEAIDRVIVSTDDEAIAAIAREAGAEVYRRPAELASDTALVIDALRHLFATLHVEGESGRIIVLLEPTCPFRSSGDVVECIHRLLRDQKHSVATFKEADLNPHRAWALESGVPSTFLAEANPWLPRQELPKAYQLNGGVYCFRSDLLPPYEQGLVFGDAGAVIMPAERSVDINTMEDLQLAEVLYQAGRICGHE